MARVAAERLTEQYGPISSDVYVGMCKELSTVKTAGDPTPFSQCLSAPNASHDEGTTLFLPCHHMVMCGVCAKELGNADEPECPECRENVIDLV
jgi:hypothetical protein